jgi:hypothetical protein
VAAGKYEVKIDGTSFGEKYVVVEVAHIKRSDTGNNCEGATINVPLGTPLQLQPIANPDTPGWPENCPVWDSTEFISPVTYTVDTSVAGSHQFTVRCGYSNKSVTVNVIKVNIDCSLALIQNEAVVNPGAKFSLKFIPASAANNAQAYRWYYIAKAPNVNEPDFPFTTPGQKETGVKKYHWYGHGRVADSDNDNEHWGGETDDGLRWISNCAVACCYEILCDVTMKDGAIVTAHIPPGNGSTGKYFYIKVTDDGETESAYIININFVEMKQDGDIWKVTGKGGLLRQSSLITNLPAPASQFYNKTKTHEEVHKSEWETMTAGVHKYFNVDTFFNRIKGFAAATKDDLQKKIRDEYAVFKKEQENAYETEFGTIGTREKRAYHAEYNVDPKGVRERSDTWIENKYGK